MRPMRPFTQLIDLDEAMARVLAAALSIAREDRVSLGDAAGRVLARDVAPLVDSPPFDRALMDGYAVASVDTAAPEARLRLLGDAFAGKPYDGAVTRGACVRIATGAKLPEGADAVVRVEDTRREGDDVRIAVAVKAGRSIERRGSELGRGSVALRAGTVLSPSALGLLATVGHAHVAVVARPRVRILVTGDELTEPGAPLAPGGIYESNGLSLRALFTAEGGDAHVVKVPDDEAATRAALREAAADADLVVFAGGASVGSRDLVGDAVAEAGDLLFHGVRLKPGKPVLAGRVGAALVLGLPGNPVSALVTAHLFAVPALDKMAGRRARESPWRIVHARLAAPFEGEADRDMILPVRVEKGIATPTFRGSGALSGLTASDGWMRVDAGARLEAGAVVDVHLW